MTPVLSWFISLLCLEQVQVLEDFDIPNNLWVGVNEQGIGIIHNGVQLNTLATIKHMAFFFFYNSEGFTQVPFQDST